MVDRGSFDANKDLSFVDPRIRSQAPVGDMVLLPIDFTPSSWDVICHRGKDSYQHVGNKRFKVCIENNLERYEQARTKMDKSVIVMSIVDSIRAATKNEAGGGGFVKKKQDLNNGRWYEVGDKLARYKVGQALREAIKQKNRPDSPSAPAKASPLERDYSTSDSSSSGKSTSSSAKLKKKRKRPSSSGLSPRTQSSIAAGSTRDRNLSLMDEKNISEERAELRVSSPASTGGARRRSHDKKPRSSSTGLTRKALKHVIDTSPRFERLSLGDFDDLILFPPTLKKKSSEESSSLSDLIGAPNSLYKEFPDSVSITSSIFSSSEGDDLDSFGFAGEHSATTNTEEARLAEFDLSGLHTNQRPTSASQIRRPRQASQQRRKQVKKRDPGRA